MLINGLIRSIVGQVLEDQRVFSEVVPKAVGSVDSCRHRTWSIKPAILPLRSLIALLGRVNLIAPNAHFRSTIEDHMSRDLLTNLLSVGLDSALAQKALDAGLTLTKLREAGTKELKASFFDNEVKLIKAAVKRKEIDDAVILQLVQKCDWSCCICWKVDDRVPVILHHIVPHSKTADDSYDNLVVLCLNHHGMAHSKWEISRHPTTPELIKSRKSEFEEAVAGFKKGTRPVPGREGDGKDPASHSDVKALTLIAGFLSRPAVSRSFVAEGNMQDFLRAMQDVIRTLNTGIMKTREGDEIDRTKAGRQFTNPTWRERLGLLSKNFDSIAERVQLAVRNNELQLDPVSGFYSFNNCMLPDEIDAARHSAIRLLNSVLFEAGIDPVRGPGG
ncbi:MAG: hypothetical protein C0483_04805 [Pirellula sp.]|nr:hypothetical protein [Pirellula sp.]